MMAGPGASSILSLSSLWISGTGQAPVIVVLREVHHALHCQHRVDEVERDGQQILFGLKGYSEGDFSAVIAELENIQEGELFHLGCCSDPALSWSRRRTHWRRTAWRTSSSSRRRNLGQYHSWERPTSHRLLHRMDLVDLWTWWQLWMSVTRTRDPLSQLTYLT